MAAVYHVSAPYVTLKVRDMNGAEFVQGFYAGAMVSDPVAGESLDKHIRTGMIVAATRAEANAKAAAEAEEASVEEKPAPRSRKG